MDIDKDDLERPNDEDYDEEADSDFDAGNGSHDGDAASTSSDDDENRPSTAAAGKRQKKQPISSKHVAGEEINIELDSGDEATLREQRKLERRQRKRGEDVDADDGQDLDGWRARTRAMRAHDQEEKKRNKLATIHGSTIDVDKLWEEMNRPGPLPAVHIEGEAAAVLKNSTPKDSEQADLVNHQKGAATGDSNTDEDLITIKRKFKFAGEVHVEEKKVAKSSAEARLWLAQQEGKGAPVIEGETLVQRPLRKISRFDPNYHNLAAFKTNWSRDGTAEEPFKGPKLNVVEKSKMDWASHVDTEGLKDELDVHAKAKEGYHSRMDFLMQVEARKEEEARLARTKR